MGVSAPNMIVVLTATYVILGESVDSEVCLSSSATHCLTSYETIQQLSLVFAVLCSQ